METKGESAAFAVDEYRPGLNKREFLSALAMQGQIAHYGSASPEQVAKLSVKMADALIKELNCTSTEN